ncbi:redoxin domain-containing protein [bacterium]|nr:redoxin domain-containing protein [bacterium]
MRSLWACALSVSLWGLNGCQPTMQTPGNSSTTSADTAAEHASEPETVTATNEAATETVAEDTGSESSEPANAEIVTAATAEPPDWRKEVTLQMQTWAETQELIASFKGKVVVVDVWSTACEPCLREFPNLVALQEKYGDQMVCIGLNSDYAGVRKKTPEYYRDRVLKVLNDKDAKIVNVMCTEPADELYVSLKIDSIPAVFVYDREGTLVSKFDNQTNDNGEFTYEMDVLPVIEKVVAN